MSPAPRLAIVAIAILAGLTQIHPVEETDLWWHLWGGRLVLEQGTWFVEDHSSYLQDGQIWENAEWGFQVLATALWRVAGPDALIGLVALVAATTAGLMGALALRLGADRPWAAVGLTGLVAAASSFSFTPRPQIFNLAFVALALWGLETTAGRRRLVGLSALGLVWAHIHSSHVLLPALALCKAVDDRIEGRPWREAATLVIVLGLVALGLGPLGPGVVHEILDHAASEASRSIDDMRPPTFADWMPRAMDPFLATLVILGLAAARLLTGPRPRWGDVGWLVLGLALGATAVRFRSATAMLALPLVLRGLTAPEPALGRVGGALLGLVSLPAIALLAVRELPQRAPGLGVWQASLPVLAADLLERHARGARLYNAYGDGGYLVWRLAPVVQITLDGRTPTFFDPRHFLVTLQARVSRKTTNTLLDAHAVDWALVPRDYLVCASLRDDPAWRVVSVDRARLLLTRSEALPGVDLNSLARCGDEPREDVRCQNPIFAESLRKDLRVYEGLGGWDYAALVRLRLAGCPGSPPVEALAPLIPRALALAPDGEDLQKLALVLAHLRRFEEALAVLDQGVEDSASLVIRARVLAMAGQLDMAARAFDAAALAKGPTLPLSARYEYAKLLAAVGRHADAAEQARRCAWAGDAEGLALLLDLLPRLSPQDRAALLPTLPPAARPDQEGEPALETP